MLLAAALAVAGGLAVVGLGIAVAPELPELSPSISQEVEPDSKRRSVSSAADFPIHPARNRHSLPEAEAVMRLAFLADHGSGSLPSLHRHASHLDGLIPDWLAIESAGVAPRLSFAEDFGKVLRFLRSNAPHVAVHPRLSSRLPAIEQARILADPARRARLINDIVKYVSDNDLQGIVVDLPEADYRHLHFFIRDLSRTFRQRDLSLFYLAQPNEAVAHLQQLAKLVDFIIAASYDQSLAREDKGPAASQGWFEDQLAHFLSGVPREKLVMAIGSFAYEFDPRGIKRLLSVQQAWDRMERSGASLAFDPASLNPWFTYTSASGGLHEVWLLDAVTAFNQARAALAQRAAGVALWRLGLEDPGVWSMLGRGRLPAVRSLEALAAPEPGFGGLLQASGVLLAAQEGSEGERSVQFNASIGLAVSQSMARVPRQAELVEWHAVDPKAVALTFDDGPDATYTPQILDILAEMGVKATFYVVGRNAIAEPELLERIYREGHDVGNHSYSHANLFGSGQNRIAAELNATQRIIESQLGVRTLLFRPPFASAGYEDLETSPQLVRTASQLGYLIGGVDLNPFDFLTTADWLARQVVSDVTRGNGQVVLLHDGGGVRTATVEALPRIIDQLRDNGFHFVTTHELVGLSRDDITPRAGEGMPSRAEAGLRFALVRLLSWMGGAIPAVAIAAAILGFARLALIIVVAASRRRAERRAPTRGQFDGSVAVIVPAYNEEKVVGSTVRALLASSPDQDLEILIIDDGSTDRTSEVVEEMFGDDPRVRLLRKENGGKAAALNLGIRQTDAEVIVAVDGDTLVLPGAIERLASAFNDPGVGAAAGKVVVGNVVNLMTRFQALEYATSQNLDRRAFERFNAIGVVPGAIGAWRRQALLEVGGYSDETLAEDADLTLTLERRGWKVVNAFDAVALTEAPESLRSFMKQRFRWMFGMLQVAYKHSSAWRERPSGVSAITVPNIFVFQFGFTLLAPLMDGLLLWILLSSAASLIFDLGNLQNDTLFLVAKYWLLFQTADVMAASIGLHLNGERRYWGLLPLIVLQRFSYRQLLYVTAIRALLTAAKGSFVGWGKLLRTARVSLHVQENEVRV